MNEFSIIFTGVEINLFDGKNLASAVPHHTKEALEIICARSPQMFRFLAVGHQQSSVLFTAFGVGDQSHESFLENPNALFKHLQK